METDGQNAIIGPVAFVPSTSAVAEQDGCDAMNTISSRTPEGLPARCPVCGTETNLDFSGRYGDATCPVCGSLLRRSAILLDKLQWFYARQLGAKPETITSQTPLVELGFTDSLDTVELVMELEEEFDINVPDDAAENFRTVGDVIRYIEEHLPDEDGMKP